jgi:3-deoxy-manno-octulosonate cytidylyltransferase (CMP-KDO synthetase)
MPQESKSKLKFVVVIPARYQSSRFPGKPLVDLCGQSMLQRVWGQCIKALPADDVYIATDDKQIFEHCEKNGMQVVMTSNSCLTGTDRVYDASKQIEADIFINVQGDEPLIEPDDILQVLSASARQPNSIINAMCEINSESDFYSSTVPKVVTRPDNSLLYMSRAAIPTDKQHKFQSANKQVCIYAFPKSSLQKFASINEKTPLESIEDIEILRFLELGYEVSMVTVSAASIAIDIPEDVARVEAILNEYA